MAKPGDAGPSGGGEAPQSVAARIAEQIAPLVRETHDHKLDLLAYLLGMALKEARRLAVQGKRG